MTRTKFTVRSVKLLVNAEEVELAPVYSSDKASENYSFSKYTPDGAIRLMITNPDLHRKFQPGQEFYVDFTLVEATIA